MEKENASTFMMKIGIFLSGVLFVVILLGTTENNKSVYIPDANAADLSDVSQNIEDGVVIITESAENLPSVKDAGILVVISAFLINLVTNLLKTKLFRRVLKILHPRWRVYVPLIIGSVYAVAVFIYNGDVQMTISALMSGPVAIALHEIMAESLLGQTKSRNNP